MKANSNKKEFASKTKFIQPQQNIFNIVNQSTYSQLMLKKNLRQFR